MHFRSLTKLFVIFIVVVFITSSAFAAIKPSTAGVLSGIDISVNSHISFWDEELFSSSTFGTHNFNSAACSTGCYSNAAVDEITLEVVKNKDFFVKTAFTRVITINVDYWDDLDNKLTVQPEVVTLTVKYDPNEGSEYFDKQVYRFEGGYYSEITISSIKDEFGNTVASGDDALKILKLTGQVTVERYRDLDILTQIEPLVGVFDGNHNFLALNNPSLDLPVDCDFNKFYISWDQISGAEEYELEWTFVDNYAGTLDNGEFELKDPSDINFTGMDKNASRVLIKGNNYELSNVFESGYLLYRVRAIGRNSPNFNYKILGPWSYNGNNVSVSQWLFNFGGIRIGCVHERNKNWQYSAAYAENGKKKEVISYYDGSLRNRQSVTNIEINGFSKSIISETVYDYQGRPAVQILPTPTEGYTSVLKYYENYNLVSVSLPYNRKDYEDPSLLDGCKFSPSPLSDLSGAGKYYSTSNTEQNGLQAFLPDAEGYPFIQTTFTPDNTGRVASVSGVGSDFKMGSGHETKFYYTSVEQDDLDRLFGTEAGSEKNYKKKISIDPNGQTSIAYVDINGKVIATALAGGSPQNLVPLDNSSNSFSNNVDFESRLEEEVLVSRKLEYVEADKDYIINYNFYVDGFHDGCMDDHNICFDCIYDLSIEIRDECNELVNQSVLPVSMSGKIVANDVNDFGQALNNTCVQGGYSFELLDGSSSSDIVIHLNKGNYSIEKRLSVNNEALDWYTESYMSNAISAPDKCIDYEAILQEQIAEVNTLFPCLEDGNDDLSLSETFLDVLKADVSPGGQYAEIFKTDQHGEVVIDNSDVASVLNENNSLTGNWRNPAVAYSSQVTIGGVSISPENLTDVNDFIYYWQAEWASSLVQYHPEYCIYEWMIDPNGDGPTIQNSRNFDQEILNLSYRDAVSLGVCSLNTTSKELWIIDPYFSTSWENILKSRLTNFKSTRDVNFNETLTATEFAYVILYCPDVDDQAGYNACIADFLPNNVIEDLDCDIEKLWELYRGFYLSEKQKFYEEITIGALSSNCKSVHASIGKVPAVSNLEYLSGKSKRYNSYDDIFKNSNETGTFLADYVKDKSIDDIESSIKANYSGWLVNSKLEFGNRCESTCRSYIPIWKDEIKGCNMSVQEIDEFIEEMVNICKNGCDPQNPLGAREMSDENKVTTNNLIRPHSFSELFAEYKNTGKIKTSTICSDLVITSPDDYGHNYWSGNGYGGKLPTMDMCGCEKIFEVGILYDDQQNTLSGEELFYNTYGKYIADFEGKRCKCEKGFAMGQSVGFEEWDKQDNNVWQNAGIDYLSSLAEPMDGSLTCNKCITCEGIKSAIELFTDNDFDFYGADNFEEVLANHLNRTFNMNLTYVQYHDFVVGCQEFMPEPKYSCNSNTVVLSALEAFLDNMADKDRLLPNVIDDFVNLSEPLFSSYFIGTVLIPSSVSSDCINGPGPYYKVNNLLTKINPNGKELHINIKFSCNKEVQIVLSSEYIIDWSKIDAFANISLRPTIMGNNVTFTIEAFYKNGIPNSDPVLLKGRISNFGKYLGTCTEYDQGDFCPSTDLAQPVHHTVSPGIIVPHPVITVPQVEYTRELDACGCDLLITLKQEYIQQYLAGQPVQPGPSVTFDEFFATKTGFNLGGTSATVLERTCFDFLKDEVHIYTNSQPLTDFPELFDPYPSVFNDPNEAYYPTISGTFTDVQWDLLAQHGGSLNDLKRAPYAKSVPDILACEHGCQYCRTLEPLVDQYINDNKVFYAGSEAFTEYIHSSLPSTWQSRLNVQYLEDDEADPACRTCKKGVAICRDLTPQAWDMLKVLQSISADNNALTTIGSISIHGPTVMFEQTSLAPLNCYSASYEVDAIMPESNSFTARFYANGSVVSALVFHASANIFHQGVTISNISNIRVKPDVRGINKSAYFDATVNGMDVRIWVECDWEISTCCPTRFLCNQPLTYEAPPILDLCALRKQKLAEFRADREYKERLEVSRNNFIQAYKEHCLNGVTEVFKARYQNNEYHYTLYFYDNAGNLVKTVPPEGVHPYDLDAVNAATSNTYREDIRTSRNISNGGGSQLVPAHTLVTNYRYNSLNAITDQHTPDAGLSKFWYDEVSRLILSQNAKQAADIDNDNKPEYSYTFFDDLNRPIEVGQFEKSTAPTVLATFNCSLPGCSTVVNTHFISSASFANWLPVSSSTREQVTRTVYDKPLMAELCISGSCTATCYTVASGIEAKQLNLRKRVSSVLYFETYQPSVSKCNYNSATHYTYDVHGNVYQLWQENRLAPEEHRLKTMMYDYDLVSGNVNKVSYQPDENDQFYHRYSYDNDNRLTDAYTSRDGVIWDRDANYLYYHHGPLARVILGEQEVQGIDYAYTIQGWLKGVNSDVLDPELDMGKDGYTASGAPLNTMARDASGYSLQYYNGDYNSISGNTFVADADPSSGIGEAFKNTQSNTANDLYNGNIRQMVSSVAKLSSTLGTAYQYDQLNRIKAMTAFANVEQVNNEWQWQTGGALTEYATTYSYDANGNINTLTRNGDKTATPEMDNLQYHYYAGTNRLNYVDDNTATAANYENDLEDQLPLNYKYDEVGNLISDNAEGVSSIKWSVYGKVLEVNKAAGSGHSLAYTYGPDGQRISKIVKEGEAYNWKYTFYVRDASGNTMATYDWKVKNKRTAGFMAAYLDALKNEVGSSSYIGFMQNNFAAESWFVPGLINGLVEQGVDDDILWASGRTPLYYIAEEPAVGTQALTQYQSEEMLLQVLNDNPQLIVNNYIFQGNSPELLLAQIFTHKCADYINYLYTIDPAIVNYMFTQTGTSSTISFCTSGFTAAAKANIAINYNSPNPNPSLMNLANAIVSCPTISTTELRDYIVTAYGGAASFRTYMEALPNIYALLNNQDPVKFKTAVSTYGTANLLDILKDDLGTNPFIAEAMAFGDVEKGVLISNVNLEDLLDMIEADFGPTIRANVEDIATGGNQFEETYTLKELSIYGSSRLGVLQAEDQLLVKTYDATITNGQLTIDQNTLVTNAMAAPELYYGRTLGRKRYELTNHLGNVLAVISDHKVPHQAATGCTGDICDVDYYYADVVQSQLYYPFGMEMPGMKYRSHRLEKTTRNICVSCSQMRNLMVSYETANGTAALKDREDVTSYLNEKLGLSRGWEQYKESLKKCKILKIHYHFDSDPVYLKRSRMTMTGNNPQYNVGTGDFALEAWIKLDPSFTAVNGTDIKTIVSTIAISPIGGFIFGVHDNRALEFYALNGQTYMKCTTTVSIPLNTWTHVAFVRVGNNFADWKFYINGTQVSHSMQGQGTFASPDVTVNQNALTIAGASPAYPTVSPFDGDLREIRFYDRDLSGSEISAIYNNGCGADPADMQSLILWMPLDGHSDYLYTQDYSSYGVVAISDYSTNGHHEYIWELEDAGCLVSGSAFCEPLITMEGESTYRYGFNGQEKTDEIYGEGNSYTAEYWQYDARLGRRWNVDPVLYPFQSQYSTFSNNPIIFVDPLGLYPRGQNPAADNSLYKRAKKEAHSWAVRNGMDPDKVTFDYSESKQGYYFYGAPSSGAGIMQSSFYVTMNFWDRLRGFGYNADQMVDGWGRKWNSGNAVLEGEIKVQAGLMGGIKGTVGGVKGNINLNLVAVDIVSGKVNFSNLISSDPDVFQGEYISQNGYVVSNSIDLSVESPGGIMGVKPTFGVEASQQQRIVNGRSINGSKSASVYAVVPVLTSEKADNILSKNGLMDNNGSIMSSSPEVKGRASGSKDFYGIDFGAGASLIIGVDVNLKMGMEW